MDISDFIDVRKKIDEAQDEWDKIDDDFANIMETELNAIGTDVINRWYATYPNPEYYDRNFNLYNIFQIINTEDDLGVIIDESLLDNVYRVSTSYIYDIVVKQGYHGGAIRGEKHPSPGIPYYRQPHPFYVYWSRPAIQSFSIEDEMISLMNSKIKELEKRRKKQLQLITNRLENELDNLSFKLETYIYNILY